MRFNLPVRTPDTCRIGVLLELAVSGGDDQAIAERVIEEIAELRKTIGVPTRLRDIGVSEDMLPGFAAKAFAIKRLMRVNPRMPQSEGEILGIFQAAF
jgi:alcohol dehydrogenase class IV